MVKLQNNFTTSEQSNRLLELGVPVNSADCYTTTNNGRAVVLNLLFSEFMENIVAGGINNPDAYLPCWSVGRLIETYELCVGERFERRANPSTLQLIPIMEDILEQYQMRIESIYRHMDFSKLED